MPKNSTKAEFNNFVKGIISEASPLNFPENASLDEQNYEIDRKGTRQRRLGMDLESGASFKTLDSQISVAYGSPSVFRWKDAGGVADQDFVVVQEGNNLHVYNMAENPISADGYIGSITLTELSVLASYSLAAVDGRLVVACGDPKLALVSYKGGVLSAEYFTIKCRDFWGITTDPAEYNTDKSYRGPLTLTHYYNLQNQSWGIPRKNQDNILVDPAYYYFTKFGVAPSNSETVWPGLQFQPVASGSEPFERIFHKLYEEVLGGDTKASKGYFIIDALSRGASRKEAFEANGAKYPALAYKSIDTPLDRTTKGATIVKEFAGRVWYAGFGGEVEGGDDASPTLSSYVFFSQLVKNKQDYGKCYQEGDPTSRENADIVDTDGGYIRIAGASRIISMEVIGNSMIVLATNGVWSITGGSDYGFTATNYRVDTLSTFGCIGDKSVVTDGSKVMFWAEDGIYVVGANETGMLSTESITALSIRTLYQDIDNFSKQNVRGVYDSLAKRVRWIYHTKGFFEEGNETYELILDLILGCFYKFKIFPSENNLYEVVQGFDTNRFTSEALTVDVFTTTDQVFVSSDPVVIDLGKKTSSNRNIRYLILKNTSGVYSFSFGYYRNSAWKDWDYTDAHAYILTGAITAGDVSAVKQVPYLITILEKTETGIDSFGEFINPSGCLMRFQWDWSDTIDAGRWTTPQQVYRLTRVELTDLNQPSLKSSNKTVITKSKIRGQGRAFSVYFESQPDKDCKLLGWNISLNASPIT
jgi:hypothetical protein